jgi:hypothetical protein
LTNPELTAPHYDLGEHVVASLITTEGISIWRRDAFLEANGFDPLLAGHEGLALSQEIWRFHGPHSMIYVPDAVLCHDFATDKRTSEAKKQKHQQNQNYLAVHAPRATKLHNTRLNHDNYLRESVLNLPAIRKANAQQVPVSIITTVRNGERWVRDFTRCWKSQTFRDFQLVVVDDGSLDGTAHALADAWKGDARLHLVSHAGAGRGGALNQALARAQHDVCLIADIDDISIPKRVEMTCAFFDENPSCDWVSFLAFTEENHYRIGFPNSLAIQDLKLRCLFGMPASFPATAFRKSRFTESFDPALRAGVDCDWVRRNLARNNALCGKLIQLPLVYYSIHDGQLSAIYKGQQQEARKALIHQGYERILGQLNADDIHAIHLLADNAEVSPQEKRDLARWLAHLLRRNHETQAYPAHDLMLVMQEAFWRIKIKQAPAAAAAQPAAAAVAAKPAAAQVPVKAKPQGLLGRFFSSPD